MQLISNLAAFVLNSMVCPNVLQSPLKIPTEKITSIFSSLAFQLLFCVPSETQVIVCTEANIINS